jgi:hypothetical protein
MLAVNEECIAEVAASAGAGAGAGGGGPSSQPSQSGVLAAKDDIAPLDTFGCIEPVFFDGDLGGVSMVHPFIPCPVISSHTARPTHTVLASPIALSQAMTLAATGESRRCSHAEDGRAKFSRTTRQEHCVSARSQQLACLALQRELRGQQHFAALHQAAAADDQQASICKTSLLSLSTKCSFLAAEDHVICKLTPKLFPG